MLAKTLFILYIYQTFKSQGFFVCFLPYSFLPIELYETQRGCNTISNMLKKLYIIRFPNELRLWGPLNKCPHVLISMNCAMEFLKLIC